MDAKRWTSTSGTTLVAPAVEVRTGAGSGEVEVEWQAVSGAAGYRVGRAADPGGPFEVVIDIDVVSGDVVAASDVVNVWSDGHTYVPGGGTLGAPDGSPRFRAVDVGAGQRCFQVQAFDPSGAGAWSTAECGTPQ